MLTTLHHTLHQMTLILIAVFQRTPFCYFLCCNEEILYSHVQVFYVLAEYRGKHIQYTIFLLCMSVSLSRLNWQTYGPDFWHVGQVKGYLGQVWKSRSEVKVTSPKSFFPWVFQCILLAQIWDHWWICWGSTSGIQLVAYTNRASMELLYLCLNIMSVSQCWCTCMLSNAITGQMAMAKFLSHPRGPSVEQPVKIADKIWL